MDSSLYEQPLNEKLRIYLRLEAAFSRITALLSETQVAAHHAAFGTLFELMDMVDHGDLRADLHGDLDRQLQQFRVLQGNPNVDGEKLLRFLGQLEKLHQWIVNHQGRFGSRLRDNEFLQSARQRFHQPGASSPLDLPRLHAFLRQPVEKRRARFQQWLLELQGVRTSVDVMLRLMREQTQWRQAQLDEGYFQLEPVSGQLLRIRMPADAGVFPEVSTGRQRCVIRAAKIDDEGPVKYVAQSTAFEYALCG